MTGHVCIVVPPRSACDLRPIMATVRPLPLDVSRAAGDSVKLFGKWETQECVLFLGLLDRISSLCCS